MNTVEFTKPSTEQAHFVHTCTLVEKAQEPHYRVHEKERSEHCIHFVGETSSKENVSMQMFPGKRSPLTCNPSITRSDQNEILHYKINTLSSRRMTR